jgi:hypothetical protein
VRDDGGLQQAKQPELPDVAKVKAPKAEQLDLPIPGDDEHDIATDQRNMDRVRSQIALTNAHAINESTGHGDLLPSF